MNWKRIVSERGSVKISVIEMDTATEQISRHSLRIIFDGYSRRLLLYNDKPLNRNYMKLKQYVMSDILNV